MKNHSRILILVAAACGVVADAAAQATLATDEQKTLYALGMLISRNLQSFSLTPQELEIVQAGLVAGTQGTSAAIDLNVYGPKVQALQTTRLAAAASRAQAEGKAYFDKRAAEKGVTRTPSGILMQTIRAGTGTSPTATDTVRVHYHGTLTNGTVFDSSVQRGEPIDLALDGVIPCWTEALQQMKVGGKSLVVCPPELAYGERGSPPVIGGNATLTFEVELLSIVPPAPAPAPVP